MKAILSYFENTNPILGALYATLFTWALTALGAAMVFFVKKMNRAVLDGLLGFTGGVMVAASFWSLLAPGIKMSHGEGFAKVFPAALGFAMGALFIFGLDKVLPHIHINFKETEGLKTPWHKTTLLVLAITLHNIPEGLAVGVLFGGVAAGITPILPYALAFAAGAMIFVVVEEVIPETQLDKYTDVATLGFIGGFIVMMTLDVALG